MAWLPQFLKEFDIGSKERTAIELKTFVRCLWLSGVYDQLNGPNLCCLEEITRRVCHLVEAYESGAHGKSNWASVKWFTIVQSSSNMVPESMRSFAFRKAKEEVETENLRLRATKTVPVSEDGEWESSAALYLLACCEIESQGKSERKERTAAADSCCGRSTDTNPPSAGQPSDPGSAGPKWAAEEQHWVPFFNTIPEVPTLVSSHVPRNSCARLRQRMCRRQCQERDVALCLESLNWLAGRRDRSLEHEGTKPGATQIQHKQEVHARVRKLVQERCSRASAIPLHQATFSSCWDLIRCTDPMRMAIWQTSPLSLSGCPRLCHVVPESLRHYLENIQSMRKTKLN